MSFRFAGLSSTAITVIGSLWLSAWVNGAEAVA